MAIELITGLPGNCKTLYSIDYLKKWGEREPERPIYYSGIPLTEEGKATLNWIELDDPTKWFECPPGSIIVVDESQRAFRNRSIGQTPPRHVTELETHRHHGFDLVFITQHPNLIDPALRRLVQKHKHCIRVLGMQWSTIHEWQVCREDCTKQAAKKDSTKVEYRFNKSIYPLYKSAELHTVKRNIPMRIWIALLLLCAVIPYLVWHFYGSILGRTTEKDAKPVAAVPAAAPGQTLTPGQPGMQHAEFDPEADARKYVFQQTPRIADLPHTAPKYDGLTSPQAVPVPQMCIQAGRKCKCYTQQGTPMNVNFNTCVEIAQNGFFEEFNPNGHQARPDAAAAVRVLDDQERLPISGASTRDSAISTLGNSTGYGVVGSRYDGIRTPGIESQTAAPARL